MLIPDISQEEKEVLYKDAMDLFTLYFNPESPDNIGLPSDIVENMRQGEKLQVSACVIKTKFP